jgi:hypothetical protein
MKNLLLTTTGIILSVALNAQQTLPETERVYFNYLDGGYGAEVESGK